MKEKVHGFLFLSQIMTSVAKLHGLCKGFKKAVDHWEQEDLEDQQMLHQFIEGHEQHLTFKNEKSELELFLATLANLEPLVASLTAGVGPSSRFWPYLGLFEIQSCATFVAMVDSRSEYLRRTASSLTWWTFLYEQLPTLPKSEGANQILEAIGDKNSLDYVLTSASIGYFSEGIRFSELSLLHLALLVKSMLELKSDERFLLGAKNALKEKLLNLTLDEWINLAEAKNEQHRICIDGMEFLPSNQQLLIAHCCFLIQSSISEADELRAIIGNFARQYKREYELDLENLEPKEILEKLAQVLDENWMTEAYVKYLMTNFALLTVQNPKAIQILKNHPVQLVPFLEVIYASGEKGLLSSVLRFANLDDVQALAHREIAKNEPPTGSTDNELRAFINKAVLTTEDLEKDWLILVIQDPKYAVQTLIHEGINNPGKLDLVCRLISTLPLVESFQIPAYLIKHLESSEDAKLLVIKISELNKEMGAELFTKLAQLMLTSDSKALLCLDIMTKIKNPDSSNEALQGFRRILLLKKCRTVEDGILLDMLDQLIYEELCRPPEDIVFDLPYTGYRNWPCGDPNEVIDKVLVAIDCLSSVHQEYVLQQLSHYLVANVDAIANVEQAHEKVVLLLNDHVSCASLQNCQTALLSKLLTSEFNYKRLISILDTMPTCDAKKLSLTKLKMLNSM